MDNIRLNTKLISSLSSVVFMPTAELINASAIPSTTFYYLMQRPEKITIKQLLGIANGLHIPVRRFFSTGKTDVIGRRDDYITEPYYECSYNTEALKEVMSIRRDATWARAAKATGMNYTNLRNSLLAVRRTPVERFLTVCQVFRIDPFDILTDPNPQAKKQGRKGSKKEDDATLYEIKSLHHDIETLNQTVADRKEKYDALLKAHERLAQQVHVNIGTINGGTIGIAAEPLEKK